MTTGLVIERFDPSLATEADFVVCHRVMLASQVVDRPGEPPLPLAELVARMKRPMPGSGAVAYWLGRRGGEVVAFARL